MKRTSMESTFLSIQSDISEPLKMLENLGGKQTRTMRHLLSGLGTAAKNEVKKYYKRSGLNKQSGSLYKSITRKVLKNGKGVIIEAKVANEKNVFYGYAHTKGSLIKPKNGTYLTFLKDGKWVRLKSIKLEERNFVVKPVEDYLQSTNFKEKLDALVQKEITKIEKESSK